VAQEGARRKHLRRNNLFPLPNHCASLRFWKKTIKSSMPRLRPIRTAQPALYGYRLTRKNGSSVDMCPVRGSQIHQRHYTLMKFQLCVASGNQSLLEQDVAILDPAQGIFPVVEGYDLLRLIRVGDFNAVIPVFFHDVSLHSKLRANRISG
jgi:hypothetical protein